MVHDRGHSFVFLPGVAPPTGTGDKWGKPAKHQISPPRPASETNPAAPAALSGLNYALVILMGAFIIAKVLVPFRHFLYPGNTNCTEEGARFSWRMMLRTKNGSTQFVVIDPASPSPSMIEPNQFLTSYQVRIMTKFPDMTLQAAHYIAEDFRRQGYSQIEVRARTSVSLNGRSPQMLIDPEVDLAPEKAGLMPAARIVPLRERLP